MRTATKHLSLDRLPQRARRAAPPDPTRGDQLAVVTGFDSEQRLLSGRVVGCAGVGCVRPSEDVLAAVLAGLRRL
ncbi:hypothetical protein [Salinispora sp. H7-4]|uniref:hypothetical protein n=1 Tax=Salinispora sp. H7-4 TaxID=2748321 RepID=UPI0015D44042|nr:hypothetical protein [Salinispora sp. H7-4]NYT96099.1 hypothetical protein [Salinispora sp. H7-4]